MNNFTRCQPPISATSTQRNMCWVCVLRQAACQVFKTWWCLLYSRSLHSSRYYDTVNNGHRFGSTDRGTAFHLTESRVQSCKLILTFSFYKWGNWGLVLCPRSSTWYVKGPESEARSVLFQSSCSSICKLKRSQQSSFTYSILSSLLSSGLGRTLSFELKGNYSQFERFGEKKNHWLIAWFWEYILLSACLTCSFFMNIRLRIKLIHMTQILV